MKKIGTLGYIILGLITTSAFADTATQTPATPATSAAIDSGSPSARDTGKAKKGGKKHHHRAHKKHR